MSNIKDRKQFISYSDSKTEMNIVKCGVPQGSILGPLLFLIFLNDLNNSTKVLDSVLFADDANLFGTANQELSQIND